MQAVATRVAQVRQPSEVMIFCEENVLNIAGWSLYPLNDTIMLPKIVNYANGVYTVTGSCDTTATFHSRQGGNMKAGRSNVVYIDGHVGTSDPGEAFEQAWALRTWPQNYVRGSDAERWAVDKNIR